MTDTAIISAIKNSKMKISLIILFCFVSLSINAQVLAIDRSIINVGPEQMNEKFDLCSDTTWIVTSSESWLAVATQLFWRTSATSAKISMLYSGTAPDLGAYEFLQNTVSGHDSAFVYLIAEKNMGKTRTATITVQGTNVPGYSQITVRQIGSAMLRSPVIRSDKKLYIDRSSGKLIVW